VPEKEDDRIVMQRSTDCRRINGASARRKTPCKSNGKFLRPLFRFSDEALAAIEQFETDEAFRRRVERCIF